MIWCLGIYASASTWVYNVVLQIARRSEGPPPLGMYVTHGRELEALAPDLLPERSLPVVKTHDVDAAGSALLDAQASAILLSIRDPRDAVASLMLYMRNPFELALQRVETSARYVERWRGDPRVLLLRYEDGFTERAETVTALAERIGRRLSGGDDAAIFAASTRAAVDAFIGTMAGLPTALHDPASGDVVDTVTQWHTHHARRTGEVGRWRRLLQPAQVRTIEARLGDWMDAFGCPRGQPAPPPAPTMRVTIGRYGIV